MPVRSLSRELYEKMIAYYRERPADVRGCAAHAGVHEKTARRAWNGKAWTLYRGDWRPAVEVFAAEEAAKREVERVKEERDRLSLARDAEKARKLEEDATRFEERGLEIARANILVANAALAKLSKGVVDLSERTSKLLATGKDANGNPISIPVEDALRVIQRFTASVRGLTEATETLVQIGRLQRGKPTSIGAHLLVELTPEQVAEEVRRAQLALGRAHAMGLASSSEGEQRPIVEGYAHADGTEALERSGYEGLEEAGPKRRTPTTASAPSGAAPGIWGPGHHSFVEDGKGGTLIVYHAKTGPDDAEDRHIRIGPVTFAGASPVTVVFP